MTAVNNNRALINNTPNNPDSGKPGAGDVSADVVLGQQDFAHRTPNFGSPTGLNGLIEFGGSGLFEAFIPFEPIGVGFAIDNSTAPAGAYVVDPGNNRVLGWSNLDAFINGAAPDVVLGQPDFISSNCNDGTAAGDLHGLGPDSLCNPNGAAVDGAGNLYIADTSHWSLERVRPARALLSAPVLTDKTGILRRAARRCACHSASR